ncbi:unnamed protein product, partial [Vitis vinifera]
MIYFLYLAISKRCRTTMWRSKTWSGTRSFKPSPTHARAETSFRLPRMSSEWAKRSLVALAVLSSSPSSTTWKTSLAVRIPIRRRVSSLRNSSRLLLPKNSELTHSLEGLSGVSGILAASVFGQELFLLHFHSTDHVGLEGHYHWLLQLIVLVSLVAALAATSFPTSFPAALVLSTAVVFQGCWFMNMGFMLWVPEFVPKGCKVQLTSSSDSMHGAVACGSHDADLRARALANMQFSWILSGILMFVGSLCLKLVGKCSSKAGFIEYEQLHSGVPNVPIAIDGFKEAQT